jgi:hypothetical protein
MSAKKKGAVSSAPIRSFDSSQVTSKLQRYSSFPVKHLLTLRMQDLGIKNVDLQKFLGYPRPNVIAMIKSGAMKLPEAKVVEVADLLKVDRTFLLAKVIAENSPDLWAAISTVMADRLVTENEIELLGAIRAELGGHDVRLTKSDEVMRALVPALKKVFEREDASVAAELERLGKEGSVNVE